MSSDNSQVEIVGANIVSYIGCEAIGKFCCTAPIAHRRQHSRSGDHLLATGLCERPMNVPNDEVCMQVGH